MIVFDSLTTARDAARLTAENVANVIGKGTIRVRTKMAAIPTILPTRRYLERSAQLQIKYAHSRLHI